MLHNFFRLNRPFRVFHSTDDLTEALEISNDLRNVLFEPDHMGWDDFEGKRGIFSNKSFTNVSFSKTEIKDIIFRDCAFVDCLFIGTIFVTANFMIAHSRAVTHS